MFDLTIVGGGIIGATAFYLARRQRPDWRILLLDRSLVGKGASAYSAGLDFPYGRTPWQKQLSDASVRMYADFKQDLPHLALRSLPFVGVVKKQNLEQVLERFTCKAVHCADKTERDLLFSIFPDLKVGDDQEILVGAQGAVGFVDQIVSLLINEAANPPGGHCWEGVAVSQVRAKDSGHELDCGDGRRIQSCRVLVATGPWALNGPESSQAHAAGVRIKKVAALHVLREPTPNAPVVYFFDEDAFLLPVLEGKKWILSFTSREWDCSPDQGNLLIRPEERAEALSILARYCPSWVEECCGGRVFCDAYTPDWAPFVRSTGKNIVLAGACSGAGFRIAPAVAQTALQLFSGYINAGEV
ncbi:MAG: FAD-binding oxidoreductase [Acidobacteriia bacterium]|nr:FAD-binding oxidoreductase [Terriglobia bacterium]